MITEAQRRERRNHIGASDAPAILGVDPWRNAADVYWSKIAESDSPANEAMDVGNRMERVLLDLAAERFGAECLRRDVRLVDYDHPMLAANLDGQITRATDDDGVRHIRFEGVEAKYVGPRAQEYWGEPETDEVPDHVAIQCQFQCRVACLERAWISAAIIRPEGLRFEFFKIERDEELIETILLACLGFWQRHVVKKVPPLATQASLETVERLHRQPKSLIHLNPGIESIWDSRESFLSTAKSAQAEADKCTATLLAALGDNEAGQFPDGRRIVYASENAGDRLTDSKAAKAAYPELFTPTTRRVLRLKKAGL